jgi:hypothetical protein
LGSIFGILRPTGAAETDERRRAWNKRGTRRADNMAERRRGEGQDLGKEETTNTNHL